MKNNIFSVIILLVFLLAINLVLAQGNETDADGDGINDTDDNCPKTVNPNQADSNGNGIGDVCDDNFNAEWAYNRLSDDFDSYENDYYSLKKKYVRAWEDDNERSIRMYEDELGELSGQLSDLESDIEDLQDKIDEDPDLHDLYQDARNLKKDVRDLRENIREVLIAERNNDRDYFFLPYSGPAPVVYNPPYVVKYPNQPLPTNEEAVKVVRQPLPQNLLPPQNNNQINNPQPGNSWEEVRSIVLLGGGIFVAIALIVFLVALAL